MNKIALPLVLAATMLVFAACETSPARKEPSAAASPVRVKVVEVKESQMPDVYSASGTVRAKTTAVLASKILASVLSVSVREGDRVRAGQNLIRLSAEELAARYRSADSAREGAAHSVEEADSEVAAAKAHLDLAEVTYGRLKDLFDKRSISNQEFDEGGAKRKAAQAVYDSALARREQVRSRAGQMSAEASAARIDKSYSNIAAPFSGVVMARNVEPGALAVPGAPLLTLEREGGYRLEAEVEESHSAAIHAGERVPIRIDALNLETTGTVSEIVPLVDAASRSCTVKLDLPAAGNLRAGLFGRALFPDGQHGVVAVPRDAVAEHGQLESVLVVEDGFARSRLITTGTQAGSQVTALSGLHAGEKLIYPVPVGLQDGMPVEVQP
jgi:membrane fusion protein, multidrug efflux system